MKVVGIVGSKRKQGNTAILVREALKAAEKGGAATVLVHLGDLDIQGCRGCEKCAETHKCVIEDDMQGIYPLLLEGAAVILGSPTHFYGVSADMQAFLERCYCLEVFSRDDRSCWVGLMEALGGAYAAVVVVYEQNDETFMGSTADIMTRSLADLGYRVVHSVKAGGLWAAGEADRDRDSLLEARAAGEKLVRMMRLREEVEAYLAGTRSGQP
ncbi:MAG: flavodoxin family protein [Actinomycetota bacterium]|nr:flavodoxin family protein [Actinomycetota bacterium]MDD5667812.1 flavodoxin family protein [Actinomycetota bacterium]